MFASANCDNTYSSVSYVLSHTKKSMSSNNFEHQKYYATRALEALEKTQKLAKTCGCEPAMEAIFDGLDNLEKAIEQDDWDMGRHYTKKALENTQDVINQLDLFTQNNQDEINDSDSFPVETSPEATALQLELEKIKQKQLQLAEEQKKLLQRRKTIEDEIATIASY
ncbi:hypothetical protein SAMN04488514_10392 [Kriegella aquimaris]|uniref:Uncharacterized protein n=2 Tax=Kriegella aquimaris TaxID=192904 RepID=A0A1G9NA76_9FLAO|nr:hypothetical protein SAMN04488514_10392 [Kriegella aquimaris]